MRADFKLCGPRPWAKAEASGYSRIAERGPCPAAVGARKPDDSDVARGALTVTRGALGY